MADSTSQKRKPSFKRLPRGDNGGIQLLLIQSVNHLGKQGDLVEVRQGYAYNYLLPQGLATVASPHHLRMIDKHKSRLAEIEKSRVADLRILQKDIERQSLTIEANANDEGHLYGSVGAPEVAAALKQNNFNVTADQVRLEGPLKELGLYTVKIHLHPQVDAELKVWVVPTVTADEDAKAAAKDAKAAGKEAKPAKKEEAKPAAKK